MVPADHRVQRLEQDGLPPEPIAGRSWTAPRDDAFDGRANYAARSAAGSAADDEHRYLFGWVPTKEDDDEQRRWQWGGTLVVHEVYQRADGSLGVRPPAGVRAALGALQELSPESRALRAPDGLAEAVLGEGPKGAFGLTVRVSFAAGTRAFSLRCSRTR